MTRIGVLSDTHLQDFRQGVACLEEICHRYFQDVSLILHAGDVVSPDILMAFDGIPVYAVRGNMDPYEQGIPIKRIVTVEDVRIGLIHGWGPPEGLEGRILREFSGQNLDVLVYGHSHVPVCHHRHGILFFNPGSPVDKRQSPHCSVGILEIDEGVRGQLIKLEDPAP